MPPATVVNPPQTSGPAAQPQAVQPMALVPFSEASIEHTEYGDLDVTHQLGAASRNINISVPTHGFLQHYVIRIVASGGDDGNATVAAKADAPWSAIERVVLHDMNGTELVNLDGYALFLANQYGGFMASPYALVASVNYSAVDTNGNFTITLRVPVQIRRRDGIGSLPNMDAGAPLKVSLTLAASSAIYTTAPDTLPSLRVTGTLEAWSNPSTATADGRPTATQPPAVGTYQSWTWNRKDDVGTGAQKHRLTRVGNLIRCFMVVARNSSGVRSDSVLPGGADAAARMELTWDSRLIRSETLAYNKSLVLERSGVTAPVGVAIFSYHDDFSGQYGEELFDRWLRTVQSSNLVLSGTTGAAGTWQIITNDVVPQGPLTGV